MKNILSNKYELRENIASGGMGSIYKAHQKNLNRLVAIKLLHQQYSSDESFLVRFQGEARSMARLEHPNIIRVYDVDSDENIHYIVMEFIEGKDLSKLIDKGKFTPDEAARIAREIAEALDYAHKNHVIHRDIKPGNIIITPSGTVKVGDFGIARAMDEASFTTTGQLLGTPEYMSPEQARGENNKIDGRTDLYSLGIVMYKMLTGISPFQGEGKMSIVTKLITDQGDLILEYPSEIPDKLKRIIQKLLYRDITLRYIDARALIADLCLYMDETRIFSPGKIEKKEPEGVIENATEIISPQSITKTLKKDLNKINERDFFNRKIIIAGSISVICVILIILYVTVWRSALDLKSIQKEMDLVKINVHNLRKIAEDKGAKLWLQTEYEKADARLQETDTLYGEGLKLYQKGDRSKAVETMNKVKSQYKISEEEWTMVGKEAKGENDQALKTAQDLTDQARVAKADAISSGAETHALLLLEKTNTLFNKGEKEIKEGHLREGIDSMSNALNDYKEAKKQTANANSNVIANQQKIRKTADKAKKAMNISKNDAREAANTTNYKDAIKIANNGDIAYDKDEFQNAIELYNEARDKYKMALNTLPKPPEKTISEKDKEDLEKILNKFKIAFEKKDISLIKQLADTSQSKEDFLKDLFKNYNSIIANMEVTNVKGTTATSVLTITSLTDRYGNNIQPGKSWQKNKLNIIYENNGWGKINW